MSDGANTSTRHSAFGVRVLELVLAGVLALVLQSGIAHAQLLDLDRPKPTAPGEGNAALRLADSLDEQIESLSDSPADHARAALRTLASALLRTGEQLGESGSHRVVGGTSLARGLDELDAAIARDTLNNADRSRLTGDLILLAEALPVDPDDLDRSLRDALAILLIGDDITGGWHNDTIDGSPLAPKVETWLADGMITESTAQSLIDFDALLADAAFQPGYALTTFWIRNRINLAALGIDDLPDWFSDEAEADLKASYDSGLAALCADSTDDNAVATLDGIFYISGACNRVPLIDDDRIAASVRDAIASAAIEPTTARGTFGPTDRLIVTLDVFDRPIPQPQTRQLRPAGRAMMGRSRELRSDLEDAITESLVSGARSDPATLSLIARANRFSADFTLIDRLDKLLAPAGDERDEWRSDAARHLLTITRGFGDRQTEADAWAQLRRVGDQMSHARTILRFCDQLDSPAPELETEIELLVDERRVQLSALLRRAVKRAERSLADQSAPIPNEAIDLELRLLVRQITLIDDFLVVRSIVGFSEHADSHNTNEYALAAAPSWGLSRADLRLLLEPLESRLIQANAALLDGDDQLRATLLPMTEQDASLVRLVAWLERGARGHYRDSPNAESVFARVALGAPMPDSWMAKHRFQLAAISRYATELAAAERIDDERYIRTLAEYVRFEATRLLNELD